MVIVSDPSCVVWMMFVSTAAPPLVTVVVIGWFWVLSTVKEMSSLVEKFVLGSLLTVVGKGIGETAPSSLKSMREP